MNTSIWSILVLVLVILAVILFLLYRQGQKLQARQVESQKLLDAYSQVVSMLIIDKKKMKLKNFEILFYKINIRLLIIYLLIFE